ncbi:hypothetical protein CEUSTIGMA_g11942.t1 [Chlamydomonas eustigma]|uniref:Bulb-type lectin domain-containing protein n=1 Tax=Chlamydomonas eustigma TaxID=1157962 RepID=A0A250XN63_9CHLO|nr:hypothetical protein CEUSTIGMA_g11942.t1 [Chlamydomonas eustigma]|eukprot:GAX84521.1 hypothetical protein CEUSTIGMA_g11942.t1 [Chlamydomonas eustigma]
MHRTRYLWLLSLLLAAVIAAVLMIKVDGFVVDWAALNAKGKRIECAGPNADPDVCGLPAKTCVSGGGGADPWCLEADANGGGLDVKHGEATLFQLSNTGDLWLQSQNGWVSSLQTQAPSSLSSSGLASLGVGQYLDSPGQRFTFILQTDGNAVVYPGSGSSLPGMSQRQGAVFATGTNTGGGSVAGYRVTMQSDGNLVVYNGSNTALWACCYGISNGASGVLNGGGGSPPFTLKLQDDGNLVVYSSDGVARWESTPPPPPGSSSNTGRYVFVSKDNWTANPNASAGAPWTHCLNIAEIQALDDNGNNIALNKTVTKSSGFSWNIGSPGDIFPGYLLVDGNTDNFAHTSCSDSESPWMLIDLGATYAVASIVIFNRVDCCQNRIENCQLQLLDANQQVVFSASPPITSGMTQNFKVTSGSPRLPQGAMTALNAGVGFGSAVSVLGPWNMGPWNNTGFPDTQAKWIWNDGNAASNAAVNVQINFNRVVSLPGTSSDPPVNVTANICTDDYSALRVNGKLIGDSNGGWGGSRPNTLSVVLLPGKNVIQLIARNTGGPAGILASFIGVSDGTVYARTDDAVGDERVDLSTRLVRDAAVGHSKGPDGCGTAPKHHPSHVPKDPQYGMCRLAAPDLQRDVSVVQEQDVVFAAADSVHAVPGQRFLEDQVELVVAHEPAEVRLAAAGPAM